MLQLMREGCSYTYPPLSIARYSFIQLLELEQRRVIKLAQGFNTAAQYSNLGSLSRESDALPLSHGATHLPGINPASTLHLPGINPASTLHLPGINAASTRHLPGIPGGPYKNCHAIVSY